MELNIIDDRLDGIAVLRLAGRLDTVTSKSLDDRIGGLVAEGQRNIIVDLSGVDYISSYGLRVFLIHAKRLSAPDCAFVLCSVKPLVLKILEMSGFDRILAIRDSMPDSLACCRRTEA